MVAGVIRQNLNNAVLSRQTIDEILRTFLGNTARFVVYLEEIEPFNSEELASFALKAGLAGITIYKSGQAVSGPDDWFPLPYTDLQADGSIRHSADRQIIFMALPLVTGTEPSDFIIVGFDARRIEILQKKTGLKALLAALSALPTDFKKELPFLGALLKNENDYEIAAKHRSAFQRRGTLNNFRR